MLILIYSGYYLSKLPLVLENLNLLSQSKKHHANFFSP
ncbi:hypothetical protein N44_04288 [Microcystis aeruginosa NIES-44]|uniref:Uncharacterized protein n=1 Tax=Microcystis aeruginosa NIES-44 TaxID=449439 RepID=A0A0A1W142_MICAE|nr:hypothetical protein N44_04288 [Microcystis aeruginosa NIES-44]